jgi:hypothetical protein
MQREVMHDMVSITTQLHPKQQSPKLIPESDLKLSHANPYVLIRELHTISR